MLKRKITLFSFVLLIALTSCAQEESTETKPSPKVDSEEILIAKSEKYNKQHPYGGWYCPDNFGFKPVDIQELNQIPVIEDRLPTREEASNGSSLIFVDSSKYPNAYALEMDLPRLAMIYSPFKEMSEMIIVIQAIVVGEDTIVGYRFPSGGNGSAWLGQISFFDEESVAELGSQPMIYKKSKLQASKEELWSAFIKTNYAKELGAKFKEEEFFKSEWTENSRLRLSLEAPGTKAQGFISNHFGCIYMHIDYHINGEHSVEKMLICGTEEEGYSDFHLAKGPVMKDFEREEERWNEILEEIENWRSETED